MGQFVTTLNSGADLYRMWNTLAGGGVRLRAFTLNVKAPTWVTAIAAFVPLDEATVPELLRVTKDGEQLALAPCPLVEWVAQLSVGTVSQRLELLVDMHWAHTLELLASCRTQKEG